MKKGILLLALFAGILLSTHAQNLTLSTIQGNPLPNGTEFNVYGDTNTTLMCGVWVTNGSASAMRVLCKRTNVSVLAGTENSICWGGSCWPANVSMSPRATGIAAGATDKTNFAGDYKPHSHCGQSVVRYTFLDSTNVNDSVCFVVNYITCGLGVDDQPGPGIEISGAYPNPSDKYTFINYTFTEFVANSSVVVIDMMGSEVISIPVPDREGKIRIDTQYLPDGIYFYSFLLNGKPHYTKKLIVRH